MGDRVPRERPCKRCGVMFDSQMRGYTVCDSCGRRESVVKPRTTENRIRRTFTGTPAKRLWKDPVVDTVIQYDQVPVNKDVDCNHVSDTVYVIGSTAFPEVKIGWTTGMDASGRLRDLQVGNPYDLYVIGAFAGCRHTEKALHEMYSHFTVRGEWFLFRRHMVVMQHSSIVARVASDLKTLRRRPEYRA